MKIDLEDLRRKTNEILGPEYAAAQERRQKLIDTLTHLLKDYYADPRPIYLTHEELTAIETLLEEFAGRNPLAGAL